MEVDGSDSLLTSKDSGPTWKAPEACEEEFSTNKDCFAKDNACKDNNDNAMFEANTVKAICLMRNRKNKDSKGRANAQFVHYIS